MEVENGYIWKVYYNYYWKNPLLTSMIMGGSVWGDHPKNNCNGRPIHLPPRRSTNCEASEASRGVVSITEVATWWRGEGCAGWTELLGPIIGGPYFKKWMNFTCHDVTDSWVSNENMSWKGRFGAKFHDSFGSLLNSFHMLWFKLPGYVIFYFVLLYNLFPHTYTYIYIFRYHCSWWSTMSTSLDFSWYSSSSA